MNVPLFFGSAMAFAGAVLTLLMFFAGLHDDVEKLKTAQWVGTIGGVAIGVTTLALAMKEKRRTFTTEEDWGYGNALGVGVLSGLVGALFGAVFAYLYFGVINPGLSDLMVQAQIAGMEQAGVPAGQIEKTEPMMRKWMSPPAMTVFQAIFGFIWSTVLSLIIAIFYRKRPAVQDAMPAAAG